MQDLKRAYDANRLDRSGVLALVQHPLPIRLARGLWLRPCRRDHQIHGPALSSDAWFGLLGGDKAAHSNRITGLFGGQLAPRNAGACRPRCRRNGPTPKSLVTPEHRCIGVPRGSRSAPGRQGQGLYCNSDAAVPHRDGPRVGCCRDQPAHSRTGVALALRRRAACDLPHGAKDAPHDPVRERSAGMSQKDQCSVEEHPGRPRHPAGLVAKLGQCWADLAGVRIEAGSISSDGAKGP